MLFNRGRALLVYTTYITDSNGDAVDITTHTFTCNIKYSLASSTNIISRAGVITNATGGIVTFTFGNLDITALENRYYPYIITGNDGTNDYFVETGNFNVNAVQDNWEWTTDILEGISLSDILSQANTLLRYRDWDLAELREWANDACKDFNRRTNYAVSRVKTTSIKGQTDYQLPKDILRIQNVWLAGAEKYRNIDWIRENNRIIFVKGMENGGLTIEIRCSKMPQLMTIDAQYAEVIPDASEAIVYYCCWKAKLEDREFSEADEYLRLYSDYVNQFTDKNVIDSTEETQMAYRGQGNTLNNSFGVFNNG